MRQYSGYFQDGILSPQGNIQSQLSFGNYFASFCLLKFGLIIIVLYEIFGIAATYNQKRNINIYMKSTVFP